MGGRLPVTREQQTTGQLERQQRRRRRHIVVQFAGLSGRRFHDGTGAQRPAGTAHRPPAAVSQQQVGGERFAQPAVQHGKDEGWKNVVLSCSKYYLNGFFLRPGFGVLLMVI